MKKRFSMAGLVVVVLSAAATIISCSIGDCPERSPVNRGLFQMKTFPFDLDNGTIEILQNEVEIEYRDDEGRDWTVRYNIIDEGTLP